LDLKPTENENEETKQNVAGKIPKINYGRIISIAKTPRDRVFSLSTYEHIVDKSKYSKRIINFKY